MIQYSQYATNERSLYPDYNPILAHGTPPTSQNTIPSNPYNSPLHLSQSINSNTHRRTSEPTRYYTNTLSHVSLASSTRAHPHDARTTDGTTSLSSGQSCVPLCTGSEDISPNRAHSVAQVPESHKVQEERAPPSLTNSNHSLTSEEEVVLKTVSQACNVTHSNDTTEAESRQSSHRNASNVLSSSISKHPSSPCKRCAYASDDLLSLLTEDGYLEVMMDLLTSYKVAEALVSRDIAFIEGDKALCKLPPYLHVLLRAGCAMEKTRTPSCVKSRWKSGCTTTSFKGRPAYFRAVGGKDALTAARFSYGTEQHFLVVAPKTGSTFNDGKAAIIATSNVINSIRREQSGRTCSPYFVWSPFRIQETASVERVIEPSTSRTESDSKAKSANRGPKPTLPAEVHNTLNKGFSLGKVTSARSSNKTINLVDTFENVRKRTPSLSLSVTSNTSSNASQTMDMDFRTNRENLKKRYPSSQTSSDIDEPLMVKRSRLQAQGAGKPLSSRTKPVSVSSLDHSHLPTGVPYSTATGHVPTQSTCTKSMDQIVQIKAEDEEIPIVFVIKKHVQDPKPRRKTFYQCSTAKLLACQASAHGLSPDKAPAFSMVIDNLESHCIMRNDEDDFQNFCQSLKDRFGDQLKEVTVLPMSG